MRPAAASPSVAERLTPRRAVAMAPPQVALVATVLHFALRAANVTLDTLDICTRPERRDAARALIRNASAAPGAARRRVDSAVVADPPPPDLRRLRDKDLRWITSLCAAAPDPHPPARRSPLPAPSLRRALAPSLAAVRTPTHRAYQCALLVRAELARSFGPVRIDGGDAICTLGDRGL